MSKTVVIKQRLVLKWVSHREIYFLGERNRIMSSEVLSLKLPLSQVVLPHVLRGKTLRNNMLEEIYHRLTFSGKLIV